MDDKKRMRIAEISLIVTAASFALGSILDLMEFREKYPKQSDEALIIAVVIFVVAGVGIIWAIKNNKE
ncbi:MAG: hypothetical protein PUE56_04040 [Clostridium sp.]|nr:hypothetical protein [Clostridium sp.]